MCAYQLIGRTARALAGRWAEHETTCQLLIEGGYDQALLQPGSLALLSDAARATGDLAAFYALVGDRAASVVASAAALAAAPSRGGAAGESAAQEALLPVLLAGIACLHVFVRHNLTG